MDETTTETVTLDEQAHDAQPVEQQTAAAETTTSEQAHDTVEKPAEAENSETEASKTFTPEWLQSKGIDPTDPKAFEKVANMAFNAEKQMTRSRQQASELQKQVSSQPLEQRSQDPVVQEALERATNAETIMQVSEWKARNGITDEQDDALGKYILENQDKAYLLRNGYLSLDDIAAMSGVLNQPAEQLKAQGGHEALEKLANKQRTVAVSAGAAQATVQADDPIMRGLQN